MQVYVAMWPYMHKNFFMNLKAIIEVFPKVPKEMILGESIAPGMMAPKPPQSLKK